MPDLRALDAVTRHLEPPFALVDLDAFDRNADALVRRAQGTPIRVATKSVRSRPLIDRVLARPGYAGVLAYTLAEGLWLARTVSDVLVGYPTADRAALAALLADEALAARVTLMVDSVEHLDLLDAAAAASPAAGPAAGSGIRIRVCLDLDASLRMLGGRIHIGTRRSPAHTPAQLRALAEEVLRRPRLHLVGVMAYEGQIAGVGDGAGPLPRRWAVRAMHRLSAADLRERRAAAVAAVREVADLEIVNGGGTGSLEVSVADGVLTDVAAGSGLLGPALFDHYRSFRPEPAAFFVLPVVRRPGPDHVTVLGGGWIASGPVGADRAPVVAWPDGLALVATEGAGEVQTPLTGPGAAGLALGDRVWFRHAKAGELAEHVETLWLLQDGKAVDSAATYRGEGRSFL